MGVRRQGAERAATWQGGDSGADRHPHQLVPGGMELDLVDPLAVAIMSPELRGALVGPPAEVERLRASGLLPELAHAVAGPLATLAVQSLDQDAVVGRDVVGLKWGCLVGARGVSDQRHGP